MKAKERCRTCGHPIGRGPVRFCGKCKLPMKRGDKWWINGSRLEHRNCKDPRSYRPGDKL